MAKKILILNEGYSSNLGDQAIKASMERLMQTLGFETDFCYFTNPGLEQIPQYDYKNGSQAKGRDGVVTNIKKFLLPNLSILIYVKYFRTVKRKIKHRLENKHYDLVVIGGGQLINSSPKQKLSFFAISLFLWSKAVKKKSDISLYLIGVGVSSDFHSFEKYLYKKAISNVKHIWVRDSFSQKSMAETFNRESDLIPDIAYFEPGEFLQYPKKPIALVGIYSFDEYSRKFKISEQNKTAYYNHWEKIVKNYLDKGLTVILFYTTVSDATETFLFQKYLKQGQMNIPVADINTLQDLNTLYENAAIVYSARMHALILAIKMGCTVEAYLISQKLKSFAEEYIQSREEPKQLSDRIFYTFKNYF